MAINLTTTGTLSVVPLADLGKIPGYTHPATVNLLTEFTIDEIQNSDSLQDAIDSGYVTLEDGNGTTILNLSTDFTPVLIKSNLQATTDPRATNDKSVGYSIGSTWINNNTGAVFTCVDNTEGAAVWTQNTAGNLADASFFDGVDSTGGTNVDTTWTDIPLNTERKKTSEFTHSTTVSNQEVTIATSGTYIVTYRVVVNDVSDGERGQTDTRLALDTGSGFSAVSNSIGAIYHADGQANRDGQCQFTMALDLNADDKIKVQAYHQTGTGTVNLAAGSGLIIHSVRGPKGDTGEQGPSVAVEDLATVQVRRTTVYNFINTIYNDLEFNTTDIENDPDVIEHGNVTTDRITVKETGLYAISFMAVIDGDNGNLHNFRVRVNDTSVINGSETTSETTSAGLFGSQSDAMQISHSFYASLTANDYITLQGQTPTSGTSNTLAGMLFTCQKCEGVSGAKGDTGDTGATGAVGAAGPAGADGDMTWEGDWTSQDYTANQAVSYQGSSYVCHTNTTSSQIPTDTNFWDLLASKGDAGSDGVAGVQGPTGPAGADGDITWEGAWQNQDYTVNQAVSYNGASYVCKLNTTSSQIPTDTTYWDVLAQKGSAGSVTSLIYLTYDGSSGTPSGSLGTTKNSDGDWSVTEPGMYYIDPTDGDMLIRIPDSDSGNEGEVFSFRKPNFANNDHLITFRTENGTQKIAQEDRFYMFHPGEAAEFVAVNFVSGGATGRKWRQTISQPIDKVFFQELDNSGSPYSLNHPAGFYLVDTSGGDVVVNLGDIGDDNDAREARFHVVDETNQLILNADASDTIDGKDSIRLKYNGQVVGILADSSSNEWHLTVDTRNETSIKSIYVSPEGDDDYADGSSRAPFATIKAANDSITDNSSSKRYCVFVGPGSYTEDSIDMKAYVDIRAEGGPFSTIVTASSAGINVFNNEDGSNTLAGLTITGATSGRAYLLSGTAIQGIIKDCVIYNCQVGVEADNGILTALNLASAPSGSMTSFLKSSGTGFINGSGFMIGPFCSITNGIHSTGSDATIAIANINCLSSLVASAFLAENDSTMNVQSINCSGATNGLYCKDSGTELRARMFCARSCTNTIRMNGGLMNILAGCLNDPITYDLLIEDVDSKLRFQGEFDKSKASFPNGWSNDIVSAFDDEEDDEGNVSWGNFAVGRADKGDTSYFGQGADYVRNISVITTDSTATSTTDGGNLTDVSDDAESASGSTFSFQGTAANHTILIGSNNSNGSDVIKHWGILINQTTAAVEASAKSFAFEYWNGSAWTEFNVMAVQPENSYRYANEVFIRGSQKEAIRYGLTEDNFGSDWAKKTIDSKNLYWIRIRIATGLTTAPVFEQLKLSPSGSSFSTDGTLVHSGRARYRIPISASGNVFGEGGLNNINYTVGTGAGAQTWSHQIKNATANNSGDFLCYQFSIPRGLDTGLPLYVIGSFLADGTGSAAGIDLVCSILPVEIAGIMEADPTGGVTPVERTFANTETITAKAAQTDSLTIDDIAAGKIQQVEFGPFDISDYYEGDMIFLRIEWDDIGSVPANGNQSTFIEVGVNGYKWTTGERA